MKIDIHKTFRMVWKTFGMVGFHRLSSKATLPFQRSFDHLKGSLGILFITTSLFAQQPIQKLFVPWGNSQDNVNYRLEPGYNYGPQDFNMSGETIDILDPVNRSIKTYRSEKLEKTTHIATSLKQLSTSLAKSSTQFGSVKLLSRTSAQIEIGNTQIYINHNNPDLVSMRYIGIDERNIIYTDVNIATNYQPITIDREIWILNKSGVKLGQINIPHHYFTKISNDIKIDKSGKIQHLISSTDGIYIFQWDIPTDIKELNGTYPEKFQQKVTFFNEMESDLPERNFQPTRKTTGATRQKALEIGDTYVQHVWNCRSANLTSGVVTAPDGDKIRTADWIKIGENQKIPYKWGGFDLLPAFDNGLLNDDYAGDTYTDGGGSNYARGVDCSGFVSRCWQLNNHYSTRMMDNPAYGSIVQPYNSFYDLKPGDAFHRHGHVILFVKHNDNGSFTCVEAAASTTDWKVDYSTHYAYSMTDYNSVYYRYMEGAVLSSPNYITLESTDKSTININFSEVEYADNYTIYFGTDKDFLPDSIVSCTPNITVSGLNPNSTYFFQIKAQNDSLSSIIGNEVYAASTSSDDERILVVNGFDRSSNNRHDYITKYAEPIKNAGHGFSYTLNESVINNKISLSDYNTVIWILGDESTADHTFDPTEQEKIEEFLKQGGNLFVSGSEIGWDLEGKSNHPTQADKDFYHNFLKAKYHKDSPYDKQGEYYAVETMGCGVFDKIEDFSFDDGSNGTIDVDWPDAIKPINGSTATIKYKNVIESEGVAGVEFSGLFPGGSSEGNLVYLTFPFETIVSDELRDEVMERVLGFFTGNPFTAIDEKPETIETYSLSKNYPNPFNPTTNFTYQIPQPGVVEINIYDLTGKLVETLVKEQKSTGNYTIQWNASNFSSGVYIYRMTVTNNSNIQFSKTGKSVLMK